MAVVKDDEVLSELEQVLNERGQPGAALAHLEAALVEDAAEGAPPASALSGLMRKVSGSDRIGYFEGLSQSEIAAKTRMRQAMLKLADALEKP